MPREQNLPQSALNEIPATEVQETLINLRTLNAMGRPSTDIETEQRIERFFDFCEQSSLRPSVQSLCVALHISTVTLYRWKNGENCSKYKQELIQNALLVINSCLEQFLLTGKISPPSGIFMLKNWAGYSDTISLEDKSVQAPEEKENCKKAADLPLLIASEQAQAEESEE